MTPFQAELRAKAIEAMEASMPERFKLYWHPDELTELYSAAFDALRGVVRVVPIEVTEGQDRYFGMTLTSGILRE